MTLCVCAVRHTRIAPASATAAHAASLAQCGAPHVTHTAWAHVPWCAATRERGAARMAVAGRKPSLACVGRPRQRGEGRSGRAGVWVHLRWGRAAVIELCLKSAATRSHFW